jgi:HEAT repeat protein
MRSAPDIIAEANANNQELLYRCRWSPVDAERVVPELLQVLSDGDSELVDEALRSLFTIGVPARSAALRVIQLMQGGRPLTRQLATLTLGQIAHQDPNICIAPLVGALAYEECRHDALRILTFMGSASRCALPEVVPYCESPDAKTRRLAILAVMSMDEGSEIVQTIIARARADRSKAVRSAVDKALQGNRSQADRIVT